MSSSNQIEEKLGQFKKQIQKNNDSSLERNNGGRSSLHGQNSVKNFNNDRNAGFEDRNSPSNRGKLQRNQTSVEPEDRNNQLALKKNPQFGANQNQPAYYASSDDDIPVGFSRRKRLSSTSSFNKKFENQAQNLVTIARDEDQNKRNTNNNFENESIIEMNKSIKQRKLEEDEQERIHQETEQMLEQKREEIQQRLKGHEEAIRQEKERSVYQHQQHDTHHKQGGDHSGSPRSRHHQRQAHGSHQQQQYVNHSYQQPPMGGYQMAPADMNQRASLQGYPFQQMPAHYGSPSQIQQQQQQFGMPPTQYPQNHNYFPPTMVPNLPQYTNLDIPAHIDANLQQMRETLEKLKGENQSLKNDLHKKQVINADAAADGAGAGSLGTFDKEKYQQHAQQNLKLKQNIEDLKRREIELKSRLSSLNANKQYLHGKSNTLSMDIDQQDRQEEALNRQINDFNGLIRDKESYIKQLIGELSGLKENKDQLGSELTVLAHKEEYLVNELIFKEDQLNEILTNNDEMRRKIQSGQSQSKYIIAENDRLKKELGSLREESAVIKASSDFLQNELHGLSEHQSEYEHKLVLGQNTIDQLQRQNAQEKNELSHHNAAIASQQKAYEELKGQLQIINERNSRIGMQNEMMIMRQQQHQESLIQQINVNNNMQKQQQLQQEEQRLQQQQQQQQMAALRSSHVSRQASQYGEENSNYQRFEAPATTNTGEQEEQQPVASRRRENTRQQPPKQSKPVVQDPMSSANTDDHVQYEDNKKKNQYGDNMINTLNWNDGSNTEEHNQNSANRNRVTRNTMKSPAKVELDLTQQQKKQGGAMAGILSWGNEEANIVSRFSMPDQVNSHRFSRRGAGEQVASKSGDTYDDVNGNMGSSELRERSKSAKRQDQMNEILQWAEEETIRDNRKRQSMEPKAAIDQSNNPRQISLERKRQEGALMSGIFGTENSSPFKEREAIKQAEESMLGRARIHNAADKREQRQQKEQELTQQEEGRQIKNKHFGAGMAGLLAFEVPSEQHVYVDQPLVNRLSSTQKAQSSNANNKYGNISVSMTPNPTVGGGGRSSQNEDYFMTPDKNIQSRREKPSSTYDQQSTAKQQAVRKVGIDMSRQIEALGATPKGSDTINYKNYGNVTEQLHHAQQNRKENLDKFLLQMQIEKEKLSRELVQIGDFPKTTKQFRRKGEIETEVQSLSSNMTSIKNKLKNLKP